MKYIIILLTSLFLVSTANAEDKLEITVDLLMEL
jgi:hypothetical protein